jgi:hypothetical protein
VARLRIFLAGLVALISIAAAPSAAAYNPFGGVCKNAPQSPACQQNASQNNKPTNPVVNIIHTAADLIAAVAGVAAVIVIIISGFQFVTAGGASPGQRSGDPNKIKSARAALTGAIIGLVVVVLAWTLVTFVTDRFIG